MKALTPAARGVLVAIAVLLSVSWALTAFALLPGEATNGGRSAGGRSLAAIVAAMAAATRPGARRSARGSP